MNPDSTPAPAASSRRAFFRTAGIVAGVAAAPGLVLWPAFRAGAADGAVRIPPPSEDATVAATAPSGLATAVFAGGCFWGVQGVFQRVEGVVQAVSGYAGGKKDTANYLMVGTGMSGHAEAVEIRYDPKKVTYGKLLQIFFSVVHDPTQLNRQGPDRGPQYRSAVFHVDAAQKRTVEGYIAQLDAAKAWRDRIVTQVVPLEAFYRAEDYHQDYLTVHPESLYIQQHDLPKVEALKAMFPAEFRAKPALVFARNASAVSRR